jgi:hypothetical protein
MKPSPALAFAMRPLRAAAWATGWDRQAVGVSIVSIVSIFAHP